MSIHELRKLTKDTIDEHSSIFAGLIRLARGVEGIDAERPDPRHFDQVVEMLGELHDELARHFHGEEESRLQPKLAELIPDAAPEIAKLNQEHEEILGIVSAAQARALHRSPLSAEQLSQDVSVLMDLLYSHEAAEDRLMASAVAARPE